MKLKVNNVPGFSGVVDVKTDKNGIICNKFWRNRLKDALIDNCVEIVTERKKPKEKTK
jgi:hypothetical protein